MGLRVIFDPESVVGNMEVGVPRGMASTAHRYDENGSDSDEEFESPS